MTEGTPDPMAEFDQGLASIRDGARIVAAFYFGLTGAGVPEDVAASLTATWIETNMRARPDTAAES